MIGIIQKKGPSFIKPPIAPHLLFFWIYNLVYLLPLLIVFIWGYEIGNVAESIALDSQSLRVICTIYAEGLIAFTVGSIFVDMFLRRNSSDRAVQNVYPMLHLGIAEKIAVMLIAALFLCTKAALIPLGVYQVYAADSGEMTGGIWSFSMVCAECVVLVSILLLYSDGKRNVAGFILLSALNGINLLHGTRIIFIVTVMVTILYAYLRGILSLRRIIIVGPILFGCVLLLTYFVFLSRSGSNIDGDLSFARAVSPIVYESLFSQLSLRAVVSSPDIMNSTGALPNFLVDVIAFAAPRILVPDKDAITYIGRFSYMSPLGAFNGYAAGLIYFGVFWPIFYFFLGSATSWLHAKARANAYWLVVYVYVTADVLFRFMRDGYLIPVKILGDILGLLALLLAFKTLITGLSRQRSVVAANNRQPSSGPRLEK